MRIPQLSYGKKESAGRTFGRLTTQRRGGGVKSSYRFVDVVRVNAGKFTIVKANCYDPGRSAHLSLCIFSNGLLSYILSTESAATKCYNISSPKNLPGNSFFVNKIALGSIVHSVNGKYLRSAGSSGLLLKQLNSRVLFKLKSGAHLLFPAASTAVLGVVAPNQFFLRNLLKAGVNRWLGKRPRRRASATNPVDHPMGGRTKGGCAPKSKTSKLAHGPKTVYKRCHNLVVVSARKSRKQRIS